jgi:hypothetical protein
MTRMERAPMSSGATGGVLGLNPLDGRRGDTVGDTEAWALMQRIERLRHRADLLDRASVGQPPAIRDLLTDLAEQARLMAEKEGGFCPKCVKAGCCNACAYRTWALAPPPALY